MRSEVDASCRTCRGLGLLRLLGHHGLGRDQEARDRRGILQGRAYDLGRIDDTLADEIAVSSVLRVVAPVVRPVLDDLADDDRAVLAGILSDLPRRCLQRAADDVDTGLLVLVGRRQTLKRF
jgi:hypothetical protein